MVNVEIQKTHGLEDLFSGYNGTKLEDKTMVDVSTPSSIKDVMEEYEKYLLLHTKKAMDYKTDKILTPNEINAFLLSTKQFEENSHYVFNTGMFTSKLIQNSYDNGYNNFIFNLINVSPINSLGRDLIGKKDDPINMVLNGDLYHQFGTNSEYLNVIVDGNIGNSFGFKSKYLVTTIVGDVYSDFGFKSENLDANVQGMIGNNFGKHSSNLKATIEGNVKSQFGILSTNLTANIKGRVSTYFGKKSKDLKVQIEGDATTDFGRESKKLTAYIKGNVGKFFGVYSENLTSVIDGNTGGAFGIMSQNLVAIVNGNSRRSLVNSGDALLLVSGEIKDQNFKYVRRASYPKNATILTGKKAIKHPVYIQKMKELEEKFK